MPTKLRSDKWMSAILYVDLIVIIFPLDWRSIPRSIEPQMSLFSLHSTRILQNASTINSSIGNTQQQQQLGISIGAEGMTAYGWTDVRIYDLWEDRFSPLVLTFSRKAAPTIYSILLTSVYIMLVYILKCIRAECYVYICICLWMYMYL